MKVALTGASGFLGHYLLRELLNEKREVVAWYRNEESIKALSHLDNITWIKGELGDERACNNLLQTCDTLIHSALYKPSRRFQGNEGNLGLYIEKNITGSLQLFETAKKCGVKKVVFISTCAVHDEILEDRPLDETHPLWPASFYGAHKAAIEAFIHAFARTGGLDICALRPTGIYGLHHNKEFSKWFDLVQNIVAGKSIEVSRGGKEVHAKDVARAACFLLKQENTQGQAFNCYDKYISEFDVATCAKKVSGSKSKIIGVQKTPKHQIDTSKLRSLGFSFSDQKIFEDTIKELVGL